MFRVLSCFRPPPARTKLQPGLPKLSIAWHFRNKVQSGLQAQSRVALFNHETTENDRNFQQPHICLQEAPPYPPTHNQPTTSLSNKNQCGRLQNASLPRRVTVPTPLDQSAFRVISLFFSCCPYEQHQYTYCHDDEGDDDEDEDDDQDDDEDEMMVTMMMTMVMTMVMTMMKIKMEMEMEMTTNMINIVVMLMIMMMRTTTTKTTAMMMMEVMMTRQVLQRFCTHPPPFSAEVDARNLFHQHGCRI